MEEQDIFSINPIVSTIICSVIGIALIGDLSVPEQNAVGNWLILIGQELLTNAASQSAIESKLGTNNINRKEFKALYQPLVFETSKIKDTLHALNLEGHDETLKLLKKSIDRINIEIETIKNINHK